MRTRCWVFSRLLNSRPLLPCSNCAYTRFEYFPGTPVVPFFPCCFGVSLLKLNIQKKGYVPVLLVKGFLGSYFQTFQTRGFFNGVSFVFKSPDNEDPNFCWAEKGRRCGKHCPLKACLNSVDPYMHGEASIFGFKLLLGTATPRFCGSPLGIAR